MAKRIEMHAFWNKNAIEWKGHYPQDSTVFLKIIDGDHWKKHQGKQNLKDKLTNWKIFYSEKHIKYQNLIKEYSLHRYWKNDRFYTKDALCF